MEIPSLVHLAHYRFIRSLRYEEDNDFRVIMAHQVNRGVGLIGWIGLTVLAIYMVSQVTVLGRLPVWIYGLASPDEVTVLWDKITMALILGAALAFRLSKKATDPLPGRVLAGTGALVVTVAIVLDDVATGDVSFSPAYVTVVLLATTTAIQFRPIASALLSVGVVVVWYVSVEQIPPLVGLASQTATTGHFVYLVIIVVLSTGGAAAMYENRYAQFIALRQEQRTVVKLGETNTFLEETMSALTDAQDRLIHSEKMASLGRFATGIAHELRNPLNFTLNFSKLSSELVEGLMLERPDPGEGMDSLADLKSNLGFILKHAQRAEDILGELVLQSRGLPSQPEVTDFNSLIRTQVAAVSAQYSATDGGHAVNVTESFDPDVGSVEILAASFAQAIRNVLDNAFQAAIAREGVTGEDEGAIVSVVTERNGDRVNLAIRDNGEGIEPDAMEHIFEPFFTTKPPGLGTGLGLSIAYGVITDGHGGTIVVDSALDHGTTVRIEIPVG